METLIILAKEMNLLGENDFAELTAACEEASKLLNGLMKALNR
jgi:hypothetical protein